MTTDEAREMIISLFKTIQKSGVDIRLESDYGSDDRIELHNSSGSYWRDTREIRWRDYDDFD